MVRLFEFGVIRYEIKNGRHILVWLATWGGSLPGQLTSIPACRTSLCAGTIHRYFDFKVT